MGNRAAAAANSVQVSQRLGDTFGIECHCKQAEALVEGESFAPLQRLVAENGLVVLRGLDLTDVQLVTLARRFGQPLPGYRQEFTHPEFRELVLLGNIEEDGRVITYLNTQGIEWHSDATGSQQQPAVTLLNGVEVPARGGDTLFSDTITAYSQMPVSLNAQADTLHVVHSFDHHNDAVATFAGTNVRARDEQSRRRNPDMVDKVVQTHPITGKPHFLLSHQLVKEIIGMDFDQGMALVMEVVDYLTQPRFVYRHQWQAGDVAIFDNRSVMHSATEYDYAGQRRFMRQIIVGGEFR